MIRFSFKAITAATAAAAFALTAIAPTPAAALDDKEALGLILGLGAAAIIMDNMKDNARPSTKSNTQNWYPYAERVDDPWDARRGYDYRYQDRNRQRVRLDVPSRCMITVERRGQRSQMVEGRCLEKIARREHVRLPKSCAFDIRGDRGFREEVYGKNCLEDRGFRISRR